MENIIGQLIQPILPTVEDVEGLRVWHETDTLKRVCHRSWLGELP